MSQKTEERKYDALFDGTETKMLASSSKPWIHKRFLQSKR